MPYSSRSELPSPVRKHLPGHAQDIYLKAFNSAWQQYREASRRRKGATREETAHRVAWAAVEKVYEKGADGNWHRIPAH